MPGSPANVTRLDGHLGLAGDVVEIAFAVVVIEHVGVVGEVRFEEIEVTVEVVVADADAHAGLLFAVVAEGHAAQDALFAESAVVIIHEEQAGGGIASDVNIGPAVFVEVGGDDGHAIALRELRDAGLSG